MVKFTLSFEDDYDFKLIGLFSHIKDYRLSWEINNALNIDLIKDDNYSIFLKGNEQEHPFFSFTDEEDQISFYLLGNRSQQGPLIPEESCDYFLLIKGYLQEEKLNAYIKEFSQMNTILAHSLIDPISLKSKSNLIF